MVRNRLLWALIGLSFTGFTGCQSLDPARPVISDQVPFTKQIQVPNTTTIVQIRQHAGSVRIEGWDKPYVLLEGFKSVTGETVEQVSTILNQIEFEAYETADDVLVVEYNDPLTFAEYNPFNVSDLMVHLTIYFPENVSLELFNREGPVSVSNITSGVLIDQKQGNIDVSNIGAGLQVTSNRADVTIRDVNRFVEIDSKRGEVEVERVGGDLTLTHYDGSVLVSNVQGEVALFCDLADCMVREVAGSVTADNRRGNLTLTSVQGGIAVDLDRGTVRLQPNTEVPQRYAVTVNRGDLIARLVETSDMMLTLNAENGSIDSDFPLPIAAERNTSTARGSVNDGSHPVQFSVRYGKISVIRTSESSAEPSTSRPSGPAAEPSMIEPPSGPDRTPRSSDIQATPLNP